MHECPQQIRADALGKILPKLGPQFRSKERDRNPQDVDATQNQGQHVGLQLVARRVANDSYGGTRAGATQQPIQSGTPNHVYTASPAGLF